MSELDFENLETQIVKTQDEEGNIFEFELIDVINVDGQNYGLLIPVEAEEPLEDGDEEEVIVMRIVQQGENYIFESIDNEDEFQKVAQAIAEQEYDDEDEEDDEEVIEE